MNKLFRNPFWWGGLATLIAFSTLTISMLLMMFKENFVLRTFAPILSGLLALANIVFGLASNRRSGRAFVVTVGGGIFIILMLTVYFFSIKTFGLGG